jgi:tetratricopeptide (TPR) repeat protein
MRVGGIRSRLGRTAAAEQADRQALVILNRLKSDRPAEPAYREALAKAHRDLGQILFDEQRLPDSERELKEAAALWDALARERPDVAEYQSQLADAHRRLSSQYTDQGRIEESEAAIRRALETGDRLAREYPEVDAYQASLATILHDLCNLQMDKLHDQQGGAASLRRAVAIMDQLARDRPEMTKYQLDLGFKLAVLGHAFAWMRKFPEAEAAVRRSIAILEKLAADHPQDLKIAAALGEAYKRMQVVQDYRGEGQSALEWAGRCIQVLRFLARRDPSNRFIGRRRLAGALGERGETLMRLGRGTDALADFQEAIELCHDIGDKTEELYRVFHALTKARLGDLSGLAFLGDQARDSVKAGAGQGMPSAYHYWMTCYDAACVHAALAQLALEDEGRSPAERRQRAERDLELALDLLDKARSSGEFKDITLLDGIRSQRLLDPLRSRPRFRHLMLDLAFPADPFAAVR